MARHRGGWKLKNIPLILGIFNLELMVEFNVVDRSGQPEVNSDSKMRPSIRSGVVGERIS